MDENRKKHNSEQIDDLLQSVIDSDCDVELRNLFVAVANNLKTLNESIESAHHRLDSRKSEFADLMVEFRRLSKEVSESNALQKSQTEACKAMVEAIQMQIDMMTKSYKRQWLFTLFVSIITLVSCFGAMKGASTAASIWNIVKVFAP